MGKPAPVESGGEGDHPITLADEEVGAGPGVRDGHPLCANPMAAATVGHDSERPIIDRLDHHLAFHT